ncbi:MAG TPA: AcvB/VirJ family lysyl-phosphatidylglycerol hydrolase [Gemmatimonadaceae bacterium]
MHGVRWLVAAALMSSWIARPSAARAATAAAATAAPTAASIGASAGAPADSLGALPLTEVPARGAGGALMAMILTGDGGVATLDRVLADTMAAHGIPVVLLDTRSYLATRRTPDSASRDVERVLRHYLAAWGKSRTILVGYSHGADVLPFIVTRLPADLYARVPEVAMLGLAPNANFKFHLVDLISNKHRADDLMTVPEVEKLKGTRILCFYGADEKHSGCAGLPPGSATVVEMPGGHHFGGQYAAIAGRILDNAR